ncbi:MAG TPA: alpha/beta fold hydrolase [Cyclobacteriaceae bacterium]|nr:alpha/beta fold hydrolase [Cyclobacteriaceae bacterium]
MKAKKFDTIEFNTADGFTCNLKHPIGQHPTKNPVLLVHGAGVRGNIFNPPTAKNLIQCLIEEGYDVWIENWRGSIDFRPNEWDLDQVALNDHPAAVKKVVERTGSDEIMAIIHCQGSTSFMISAMLGLVPEVKTIISNAVSLHPIVPKYSSFKLWGYIPLVKNFFTYLNPQWGLHAPDIKSKMLKLLVQATHHEKDTMVGKFVSFVYGAGFPALWQLENLDEDTMDWIQYEFAEVPLSFFHHIKKCVGQGKLVPLHTDSDGVYVPDTANTQARIILFAGAKNKCFLPESQRRTFRYLEEAEPGKHGLYIVDGYSHLDIFLGKDAHMDVFPTMIKELNKSQLQEQCLPKE